MSQEKQLLVETLIFLGKKDGKYMTDQQKRVFGRTAVVTVTA
jgi:hypothetical protein